ncbi:MAG TPA: flagellar motor protein MotB, partial [Terracidiphilus sp.]|nr:flagellar motor protein MotB [Terracidiphilus sp.]
MPGRRRAHAEEAASHERWLLSYSDFITLLFAFFVVLYATTYKDNQAIKRLSRAISRGFQTMGAFSGDEPGKGTGTTGSLSEPDQSQLQNDPKRAEAEMAGSAADMQQL